MRRNLLGGFVIGLLVVACAAVEDWFGRFDYAGDAVAYLDMASAIRHGDWTLSLSPYWSIGYPMILAVTRWIFPSGPQGEWMAVHAVNLVLFLATYLSFLCFLKVAVIYAAKGKGVEAATAESKQNGFVCAIGTSLFLLWQLLIGNVSRVSPDLMVSCLFFLVMTATLHFFMRPSMKTALLMGLLMGIGFLMKSVFLPISAIVLLVALLHALTRLPTQRLPAIFNLAWALPAMALVGVPYIAAISNTLGSFTLGETGGLNYAWNVNHLPCWSHWQGGPASCGTPIHPTHLLLRNPPVFEFAEPFHVTYPAWFNPYYWYEGYHRSFSLGNQLSAIRTNFSFLRRFFFDSPHYPLKAFAAGLLLAIGLLLLKERRIWWKRLVTLWPLYLPSIAVISLYLLVFIEPRYVIGPVIILLTLPFLCLFVPTQLFSTKAAYALAILIAIGSAAILIANKKDVLHRAIHDESYTSEEFWRIGLYLARSEVHPGDKVASVRVGRGMYCTWAYVGGVHVVAEIGNDAFDPEDQKKDFQLFTNNPEVQQTVFNLFRQAGAVLVVALDVGGQPQGPGWKQVPGTQSWIHRLDENAP